MTNALNLLPPERLVLRREVTRIFGITRTSLTRWERSGKLPPPVKVSPRVQGWPESVIRALLAGGGSAKCAPTCSA